MTGEGWVPPLIEDEPKARALMTALGRDDLNVCDHCGSEDVATAPGTVSGRETFVYQCLACRATWMPTAPPR